ncbi:MAG: hypothetical protein IIA11_03660 [Proteobacteria bacterium]|nr:hypothetical protein [Pseudomonadota bacterium]
MLPASTWEIPGGPPLPTTIELNCLDLKYPKATGEPPLLRAIAARQHIEIFRNYSSFGMGGVSRASQIYVNGLLELERVAQARNAICLFYGQQRSRYGASPAIPAKSVIHQGFIMA